MILVAGPYRSGTGDDPVLISANLEDIALPLAALAGSTAVGDAAFDEVFHPVGRRLVPRCDAVLRLPGTSSGSDEMVEIAESLGLQVFYALSDVPTAL